ncbi:hypothetical protein L1787_00160 [Acuticoccus sp. M5D2P5]|uniref:hypothetical protein n=1 Tax=Acuticoccus kalidii TaxID=2910977 RepID=UPI001F1B31E8|nr:hypothetical protein [Acuticoccus kalidii]MCF3931823.1 hypothetical protein [Acuticoccus kalidii]
MLTPVNIITLGDYIDYGMALVAWCRACPGPHREVDLALLAERLGHDHRMVEGELKLRCSRCGSRDVAVLVSPPVAKGAGGAHRW